MVSALKDAPISLEEEDKIDDGYTGGDGGGAHVEDLTSPTTPQPPPQVVRVDSYLDDEHVRLGWRSWVVVFITCFA